MAQAGRTSVTSYPACEAVDRQPWSGRVRAYLTRLLAPTPMRKVGLFFLADDGPAVVSVLGRLGVCQLQRAPSELNKYLAPFFPDDYRAAFRQLREPYEALAQRWQMTGAADCSTALQAVPSAAALTAASQDLNRFRDQVNALDQRLRELRQRQDDLEQFEYYVRALAELDINIHTLTELRFLHLRAGTVPQENLDRLRESAALSDDLVLSIGTQQERAYVLVLGAGSLSADLEGLLAKAHFVPLSQVPVPSRAEAPDIRAQLQTQTHELREQRRQLEQEDERLQQEARAALLRAGGLLAHAAVLIECDGAMEGRQPLAFLNGWAPEERLTELEQALVRDVPHAVALVHEPPPSRGEDSLLPPSALDVPVLFRPSAVLVRLFGVPGPDELNPSLVLAATTPLFFGMMFGDVGQGLLLAALALAARRWLGRWLVPALSCSLSCVVFGLLYGSVFGVEDWLPPLWLRPMREPFRLLGATLWVGVSFLLLTFLLKAANLALQRRWLEALLGFPGGGGAVCYLGGIALARALYQGKAIPAVALGLLVVGLSMTLAHAILELRAHGRSVLGTLLTEIFHGGLSLVTNTLSFLRLAAFALNHGALSFALFLLVAMIPPTPLGWVARGLVVIVGSAFILVLDVLVVAVQTIRLEFYEGLTRYYRGDGREFQPLRFPATQA